jgi:hypothetical protein
MLVGLTGYAGSGKDTAAAGLIASGWKRVSFAEPLRKMLTVLNPIIDRGGCRLSGWVDQLGWDKAKQHPEVRRFLQILGTEVGREMIDPDLWTKLAKKEMDRYHNAGHSVVFTDVRFKNEAEMIKLNGGKVIRIYREGTSPARNHVSDTNVDLLSVDFEIVNNGSVEDLQNTLKSCLGL